MNPVEKVKAWVKKNPRVAAAVGLGGAFVWIKRKGSGGGGTLVETGTPTDGPLPGVDPEGTGDFPITGGEIPYDPEVPDEPLPADSSSGSDVGPEINDSEPRDEAPVNAGAADGPIADNPSTSVTSSGITIAGKDFPGATSRSQVGSGKNEYGSYTIWLVSWPTKTERWWHYFKDEKNKAMNKWTGPHGTTGNSGGPAPGAGAPATVSPGTGGGGGVAGGKPKCSGEYPFQQDAGSRKDMCYKVVLQGTKKYRFYSNGDKVFVEDTGGGSTATTTGPVASSPGSGAVSGHPAPAPAAPAPPPRAPAAPPPCPTSHPFRSDRGCYRVVLSGKDRYHYYSTGEKIKV